MAKLIDTLGQRILHAARLAAAMHGNQLDEAQTKNGQRVVTGRAHHADAGTRRQRLDEPVDAFVRSEAADEQHTPPRLIRVRRVALRVGATVDDTRARRRRVELVG